MEIITNSNFEEKISKGYALVDFYASWCGPCKMITPILEKMSANFANVKFYKVDVDQDKNLAQQFDVMSIPTVILFKDGKKINLFNGFLPEAKIAKFLEENVK